MKSAQSTPARSRASWLLALALGALGACASQPTQDQELTAALHSWRGATYDEVVMAWGTPSQSGKDSHTWLSDDTVLRTTRPGGGAGGVLYAAARCDRTLAFRDGRVVDGRWSGEPSYCRQYARRK